MNTASLNFTLHLPECAFARIMIAVKYFEILLLTPMGVNGLQCKLYIAAFRVHLCWTSNRHIVDYQSSGIPFLFSAQHNKTQSSILTVFVDNITIYGGAFLEGRYCDYQGAKKESFQLVIIVPRNILTIQHKCKETFYSSRNQWIKEHSTQVVINVHRNLLLKQCTMCQVTIY